MKLYLAIAILATCAAVRADEGAPVITTEEGQVSGRVEKAINGGEFYSYYGIPYGEPPTGELRFKDPKPAGKWEGVMDGTTMPLPCIQVRFGAVIMGVKVPDEHLDGDEDCLRLNVFMPKDALQGDPLPVMVFIHGGGFFAGAADEYLPHVILSKEVILVIVQYRLGFLGFLSTEDSVMPGNYGLKDQTLSLQWVQRNIQNFGGDPKRVTIFGESAGGASVHYQMLTPKAEGLFAGVIAQSGNALCQWAYNDWHTKTARDVGALFGCSLEEGSEVFLKCMQSVDAKKINAAIQKQIKWFAHPLLAAPRIDGDYLPDHPARLLKEGRYNKVNLMTGITADEGAIFTEPLFAREDLIELLVNDFEVNGPYSLEWHSSDGDALALTKEVYKYYVGGPLIDLEHANELTRMLSDHHFIIAHDLLTEITARQKDFSTYRYELTYRGQMSFGDALNSDVGKNWVAHAAELFYFFRGGPLLQPFDPPSDNPRDITNEGDLRMRQLFLDLWVNFAAKGNPTPDDSLGFIWTTTDPDNLTHLELTPVPTMKGDTRKEVRRFHASLPTELNRILHPSQVDSSIGESARRNPDEL